MSETVSKAHHEAVVRGLSATIVAQGVELERLRAVLLDVENRCTGSPLCVPAGAIDGDE